MNKKRLGVIGAIATAALAITGTVVPVANAADKAVVIWADADRTKGVRDATAAWSKSTGITVTVVTKDFGKMRDEFITAGPKGLGPDILVGPHDWIGQLAASGSLQAITTASINQSQFASSAVAAMKYKGTMYGVPYNIENVAMFVNKKLAPKTPTTFADLEKIWADLKAAGTAKVGLEIPYGDPYHHTPVFTALGGYVFGVGATGWKTKDIGLYSKAFAGNAAKLDGMFTSGLLSKSSNYDFVQWFAGKAPFMITGPWNLEKVQKSGIDYEIASVPAYSGTPAQPWVGVNGFMMSKFAKNKLVATKFLKEVVASTDFQVAMFKLGNRMPAFKAAQADSAVVASKDFAAFGSYGSTGVPMPNIPQMDKVWSDWGNAFKAVADGKSTAAAAFKLASDNVKKAVG